MIGNYILLALLFADAASVSSVRDQLDLSWSQRDPPAVRTEPQWRRIGGGLEGDIYLTGRGEKTRVVK